MEAVARLSTTDLKLAAFRAEVLETYAESRGIDLAARRADRCVVCGGSEPDPGKQGECDHPDCPADR